MYVDTCTALNDSWKDGTDRLTIAAVLFCSLGRAISKRIGNQEASLLGIEDTCIEERAGIIVICAGRRWLQLRVCWAMG